MLSDKRAYEVMQVHDKKISEHLHRPLTSISLTENIKALEYIKNPNTVNSPSLIAKAIQS